MVGEIPVYGPGTSNRLIPGFGVTKAPYNFALTQLLGDRVTWNNFGQENQPVLFEPGHDPLEYALAQDFNNPNHIRQWNPLLVGILDPYKYNTTSPALMAQGIGLASRYNSQMLEEHNKNMRIIAIAQALGTLEGKLTNTLQNSLLTDAQKNTIKKLIEEIQAKREEIQKKLQKDSSIETIEAIQGEVIAIQEKVSDSIDKIIAEVKKANGTESTDGTDTLSNTDNVEGSDKAKVSAEDAAKKFDEKQKKDLTAALDICKDIYAGSVGHTWGTDYNTIRKGTAKINKDNVATVILAWDQQHKPSSGKSLVKALFDEEHFWNPSLQKRGANNKVDNSKAKNIDMIWNITVSLEEKAKELGIYNELVGAFTAAYDELDDTSVDEEKIETAIEQIAKAVYEKQAEKELENIQNGIDTTSKADADKKAKAAKAKETADAKKAGEEANKLFVTDLRDVFEDDSLEKSESVEYKDGKFQIRIKGEVYTGKTFNELKKNIEDAGYDAKKYLAKQKLSLAA